MSWIWAALTPHPPIIVPQVGRGREREAAVTLDGAGRWLDRLRALPGQGRPDVLLILSPHQNWARGALYLNTAAVLQGDLGRFGAPEVGFELTSGPELAELGGYLQKAGLPVVGGPAPDLTSDHGSLVPLSFLARLYEPLPPVILASPIGLSPDQALELGRTLAAFPGSGKLALLASGDLSHRLTPQAPAGYDPLGAEFDRDILAALETGRPGELLAQWPPRRLERAGECGFRSGLALLGLAGGPVEILSYEGPFGVGYAHAWWEGTDDR